MVVRFRRQNESNHAHAVLDGTIGESFKAVFSAKSLHLLAWGENGMRYMTNSRRPIAMPDDLKGLKMRVPQSDVLLRGFQVLGVEVASLPFPKLYEACVPERSMVRKTRSPPSARASSTRASRSFAAEAESGGLAALQQNGMVVQRSIDKARFAAAMASANPEFEKRFGKDLIERIKATR